MSDFNFQEDLEIDRHNLEEEWYTQPANVMRYSEALAEAKRELSDMDLALKVRKAEVALSIRNGEYPDAPSKITEGVVKELIEADKELSGLQREINEKREEVDKIEAAVNAFQHKKHALIKTTELWIAGYHSEVKVPNDDKEQRNNLRRKRGN